MCMIWLICERKIIYLLKFYTFGDTEENIVVYKTYQTLKSVELKTLHVVSVPVEWVMKFPAGLRKVQWWIHGGPLIRRIQ